MEKTRAASPGIPNSKVKSRNISAEYTKIKEFIKSLRFSLNLTFTTARVKKIYESLLANIIFDSQ